jgi:ketosteroid isomerase-like protein
MASPQKLLADEAQVLSANLSFYSALRALDAAMMAQVWSHEDWVKCLHPGWELIMGWDKVRESWEKIFQSTEQMMVAISRPLVHVAGDVAWVSCLENVTSSFQNDFSSALIEATNIFQRRNARWLLVHHHTTPLVQPPPDVSAPVQ